MTNSTEVDIAAANYEAQVEIFDDLQKAFVASGGDLKKLADDLDIPETEAQARLDGQCDLRMSEVRHLANAIGAHARYRLTTELAAVTVDFEFAALGTDEDGDQWITAEKYDDAESAQEYVDRFGGAVHRRSLGEWVALNGAVVEVTR